MKYEIHQIQLNELERDIINTHEKGHFALPKQVSRISFDMKEGQDLVDHTQEAIDKGYYKHYADIIGDSLNDVFYKGNMDMPREENPNIYNDKGMHSVSVGDLLIDEYGDMFVVAGRGFEFVGNKTWEAKI